MRQPIQTIINTIQETINLENLSIQNSELKEITDTIKIKNPTVKTILLNNNKIDDAGAIILSKSLQSLQNLEWLDLQFNEIDKPGITALLTLKKHHPIELKFALHGNKITDVGEMKQLEEAILMNHAHSPNTK